MLAYAMPTLMLVIQADQGAHEVQFVPVADHVQLEVLSFGGRGRPMVLLAGMGNTAHVFDRLGPRLTSVGSVYAITRRGFGFSSRPSSGYDVGRLGEDVLEVIDRHGLDRPIVIGHSVAGQELSYLAAEHGDRIAGLVYLDAGFRYAYDPPDEFERDLPAPPPTRPLRPRMPTIPEGEMIVRSLRRGSESVPRAIDAGMREFTEIDAPVLAIFASDDTGDADWNRWGDVMMEHWAHAFESGVPHARVLRWPRATHYLFLTREADVVREISGFLSTLP